jgi:sigma-E factor negative regulatory protein RseA
MKQDISALMDAELSEHERARVLKALLRDCDLRATWERYHVIRAALSKDLGPLLSADLSSRIAERVGQLPAPDRTAGVRRWRPAVRWAGAVALAASVGAVAVLGTRWFVPSEPPATLTPVASLPLQQGEVVRAGLRWDTNKPEVAKQLNIYLIEHNEFMPTSGMNSVMSYGRFVSYDNSP